MISRNLRIYLTALFISLMAASSTLAGEPEGVLSPLDPSLTTVPTDIRWSEPALETAGTAINYFRFKLTSEINIQKSKGAVKLEKIYSKVSPEYSQLNLKNYGLDLRPYIIKGFDSRNRLVRTSNFFPEPTSLMASHMVHLSHDKCSLKDFSLFDVETWWQTTCEVVLPSKTSFLRASLRSWLRMTDGPVSFASFPQQQLDICFKSRTTFTLIGQELKCPALSKYFNSQTTVDLHYLQPQGGYEITVNEKVRTFSTKYFAPDFYKLAIFAKWNQQLATITFTSSNN